MNLSHLRIVRRTLLTAALLGFTTSFLPALNSAEAAGTTITGAGATFPFPVYAKWAEAYQKETGVGVNYQSIGSGGGIKQIKARTVTFGASDAPLQASELAEAGLVQWPQVMGGIVPVVNLDGVKPGTLVLNGETLAKIFLGTIKTWDDPAIKALNPSVKLPSTAIAVVHRSDGSGTTFNFTDYLSKVSPEWKTKVGSSTAIEWPVGIGAKGNEGVANNVLQTKGAIGYVEYAYAKQSGLTYTALVNREGKQVQPTSASFQAAAANADWANSPGFYQILTNEPGATSWPITAATFILMPKQPADTEAASAALKFFAWSFAHGAPLAEQLDYIPLPASVVSLIQKTWAAEIKGADGKSLVN